MREETAVSIMDRVVAKIDEEIDAGSALIEACQSALDWIKREGLGEELLAAAGVRLLSDLYRNRAGRPAATPEELPAETAREWSSPGASKVAAAVVNRGMAIFRDYEAVVGKRLGDCTVKDLEAIAQHRADLATANRHSAACYRKVAKEVAARKAKTVQQAFKNDPDELRTMLQAKAA